MSSPHINNVLLVGCIVIYSTVFFQSDNEAKAYVFCKVRTFTFVIGFSIVFGALFSKTYRVYKIFTSKKAKPIIIRDIQLIGFVFGLMAIDILVLTVWEITDPQTLQIINITQNGQGFANNIDVIVQKQVAACYSTHTLYFTLALYIIQGLLMSFGAFLAWETRKVSLAGLNDSKYIGMCIYNVVILSVLGATMSLVIGKQVDLMYGLLSGFQIAGTTLTQLIVFVPKVLSLNHNEDTMMPSATRTQEKIAGTKRVAPLVLNARDIVVEQTEKEAK